MAWIDLLRLLGVVLVLGLAIRSLIKSKRRGGCGCGCADCDKAFNR